MKAKENMNLLDENNSESIVDITKLKNYFEDRSVPDEQKSFEDFAVKHGKNSNTEAIFDHLNTMWTAKSKGKSFDTEILVDKTTEKIFAGTDTIKAMISLFLVCGILGTLFGLAISLEHFDPSKFLTGQTSGNTQEFSNLFTKLKSAFAPSINGVIFTILFVLGYTYCIQEKCVNALNQRLTIITIKKWIPVLFPSESEESVREINAAIDKANRISENYEEMDDGLDKVVLKLGEANETVSRVIEASDALKDTAITFKDGANIINDLSASVQTLSNQSNDLKIAVTSVVSKAVENAANLHKTSVDLLSGSVKTIVEDTQGALQSELEAMKTNFLLQQKQLEDIVNTLKLYDAHFAESNSKVQDSLVQSYQNISEATADLKNIQGIIDEKDKKIMHAVGQPLQQQLHILGDQIALKLGEISVKVGSLQDPMSESARVIQTMFANMSRHNEALAKEMAKSGMTKEQIEAINKQLSQNITVDNTALEIKLDAVVKGIEKLEQAIKELSQKQKSYVPQSSSTVDYGHKFDIIADKLDNINQHGPKKENAILKMLPFAAVALLFVSIVVQVFIMIKLSDMTEQQVNTNKVITELKETQNALNSTIQKELIENK